MTELDPLDVYTALRRATPEDLLHAAIFCYVTMGEPSRYIEGIVEGLQIAIKIVGPDGWRQIAPAWLRGYQQTKEPPLEEEEE